MRKYGEQYYANKLYNLDKTEISPEKIEITKINISVREI